MTAPWEPVDGSESRGMAEILREHLPEANEREGQLMDFLARVWCYIPPNLVSTEPPYTPLKTRIADWMQEAYGFKFMDPPERPRRRRGARR